MSKIKTKRIMAGIFSLVLVACGNHREEELLKDVDNMCKCYLEGQEDSRKYMECAEKNEKARSKYRDDSDLLTDYDKRLTDCMSGN